MSVDESFDDFMVHTVRAFQLGLYLNGESVSSATAPYEQVKRPPLYGLCAMQHEEHPQPGYIVRVIWRRP